MQTSEYQNIYKNEATHFFYVGNHNTILKLVQQYASSTNQLHILDAGCGTGLLAKKLSKFGTVKGIDYNELAVKLSRKRGVDASLGSVSNLPFKDSSFNLVISIDVLYHTGVENDQQAIKEFFRVLKPGGLLILKLPAYNWLRGKHDIVVQTNHRYTTKELNKKLENAGFKVLKLTYFSSFLLPLAMIKRLLEYFDNHNNIHSDVKTPPPVINKLLIMLYKLETILFKYANLPFGLSVIAIAKKP